MMNHKIQNGVYGRALRYLPYAQACVKEYDDGTKVLVGYVTEVARINPDNSIECDGLYSATTRKHISAFARENGFTYYDFKNAYTGAKKEV